MKANTDFQNPNPHRRYKVFLRIIDESTNVTLSEKMSLAIPAIGWKLLFTQTSDPLKISQIYEVTGVFVIVPTQPELMIGISGFTVMCKKVVNLQPDLKLIRPT